LFNNDDITQHVIVSHHGEAVQFIKGPQTTGDPCPFSFDITFTGTAKARNFTGTLVDGKGRTYDWEGIFGNEAEVSRDGDNQRVKGSDGLMLDPLLYAVTSIGRELEKDKESNERDKKDKPAGENDQKEKGYKPVDLAQREADRIFGRVGIPSILI
jgi:hypothetical protein